MIRVLCLTGFLGQRDDLSVLRRWEVSGKLEFEFFEVQDLLKNNILNFERAWEKINIWAIEKNCNYALGYSLGGRLLMGAMRAQPELWKKAVIVSAHPGLKNNEEKQTRIKEDQKWAEKFLTLNWKELLQAWDSQSVFCGAKFNLPRKEEDYQRMELAQILDMFSLGRQPDFSNHLKGLDIPVLYVSGEKDIKYTQLGQNLVLNSKKMKHLVVPQVGHRVFWEGFFDQKFDRIKMFLEE